MRAVHRLQQVNLAFLRSCDWLEAVLAVMIPVTWCHVKILVSDMRSDNLLITIVFLNLCKILLKAVTQSCTSWEPHRETFANHVGEHEKLKFTTEFAVVTFLRFLKKNEVFLKFFLLREGDTVDTCELLAVFITTPVSASDWSELHCLDAWCIRDMRSAAQISETSWFIICYGTVFKLIDKLYFVLIAFLGEIFQCVGLANVNTLKCLFFLGKLEHLFLDLHKVFFGQCHVAGVDVIVETVLDSRTYAEFHAFVKLLDSLSHEVSRRVPHCSFSLRVVPCKQLNISVLVDWTSCIPHLVIHLCWQHVASQAFADAFGNVHWRYARFKLSDSTVRKCNIYHIKLFFAKKRCKITKFFNTKFTDYQKFFNQF